MLFRRSSNPSASPSNPFPTTRAPSVAVSAPDVPEEFWGGVYNIGAGMAGDSGTGSCRPRWPPRWASPTFAFGASGTSSPCGTSTDTGTPTVIAFMNSFPFGRTPSQRPSSALFVPHPLLFSQRDGCPLDREELRHASAHPKAARHDGCRARAPSMRSRPTMALGTRGRSATGTPSRRPRRRAHLRFSVTATTSRSCPRPGRPSTSSKPRRPVAVICSARRSPATSPRDWSGDVRWVMSSRAVRD